MPDDDCIPQNYSDLHLSLDFREKKAVFNGQPLKLRPKEYEVLAMLALNSGKTVPRQQFISGVFHYVEGTNTRTLDVHVRHLREKLGEYGKNQIETVFGKGYRLQPILK